MKKENLIEAQKNLDKFSLNDVAERDIAKLSNDGLNIVLPNETIYDKFVNLLDGRKAVLDRKVDILHKYYSDSKLVRDLSLDHINHSFLINLARQAGMLGLVGYSAYTSIFGKAPFMKLPGLAVSLLGIHCATRCITNDMLEKSIERPWKIHTHRLSKGLGPTNVRWNDHQELYRQSNYYKINKEDYLFQAYDKGQVLSIYTKLIKPQIERPYHFEFTHTNTLVPVDEVYMNEKKFWKDPNDPLLCPQNKELLAIINDDKTYKHPNFSDNYIKSLATQNGSWTIHKRQTEMFLSTFEASRSEEAGEIGYINKKNDFYFPLNFPEGKENFPDYFSKINDLVNFDKQTQEKFFFDCEKNNEMRDLLKKVHYLREIGADEAEVNNVINSFNETIQKKVDDWNLSNVSLIKEIENKETLIIHSEKEKSLLRKYLEFVLNNKIEMIKEKEAESHDFDFEIDEKAYDPWEEYKQTYKDLLTKGRGYFIIQSIPEWKFLQLRKPTPKVLDELVDKSKGEKFRDHQDSIFEILALERYHHERTHKDNRFQQENQTHRI